MTTISDERLAEIVADKDNFYRDEIKSMARELQSLRAQGGMRAKPTVEQAIESLVSALDEMRSQQAKRDEFLATLIVNIEKNEPTAEFAVSLREYVQNERAAALAAKGGSEPWRVQKPTTNSPAIS